MSKSPYIPPEVKAYIEQYKIEEIIKDAVNSILTQKPTDPYTTFSQYFGKLSTPVIELEDITGTEILNSELKSTIQLIFTVQFKNQQMHYNSPLYFSQSYLEQEIFYDDEQKNMKNVIKAIEKLATSLKGKKAKDQKQVDDNLLKYLSEHPNHINVIQQISFSLLPLTSHFMNQNLPKLLCQQFNTQESQIPKIFVNLLQGSKLVASKCKVYKFLLICEGENALQKIQAVVTNVRKAIVSGKKGEAGLQYYSDGTFICPGDTVPDNLKIIEQSIDAAQLKDQVSIGLVWLAELFYVPEEKKYDLDNPKKLLDADQMIDYYFKLCQEKQIISYLEDPLFHGDIVGWTKLTNKFKDTKVKIGSRRLYSNLDKAKKHCEVITAQTNPDLNEQQITQLNNERINIDYIYKPLYEYSTFTELQTHITYMISKKPNLQIIIGDTLFDTEDSYYIDVAFAIPNGCVNMGPPVKFEKIIKYNKFLKLCHGVD